MTTESTNETANIDERLAEFRELKDQFEQLRERVRRAEANKHTVNRRVYERVRAEYDRDLDALRSKMTPLRAELESVRTQYEQELREGNLALTAVEEELAEVVFRNRVGEFGDDDLATRREEIDGRLETARERIRETRSKLEMLNDTDPDATPAPEAFTSGLAPAPESPRAEASSRRPVLKRHDGPTHAADAAPDDEPVRAGFENPHDWAEEIAAAPEPAHVEEPAPEKPDAVETPSSSGVPHVEEPGTNPSLVFVTGPHAGQSIPLLSTTLTIGREHDNNIEIKDADVARYHARVMNDRGKFVVEDIGSATGTWINGERVQRAELTHGDVIKIGQTEIAIDFEWTLDPLQRAGVDPAA